MRRIAIPLLAGMVFCCTQSPAQKLEFKEHLSKEFIPAAKTGSTLAIYNVNGFIRVEGYAGDKVILEIDKTISAKTNDLLEQGKAEFKLETEQVGDSIIAYISDPFDSRPNRNRNNWNNNKRVEYNFDLDFIVKVPFSTNLHVSTVNGGDVTVKDVTGSLGVFNINGAIKVTNAKGATEMSTINGDVDVNFITGPVSPSSFKTLNGNINISCPATLSADCQFKSFRGEFFTDFPDVVLLPAEISKNEVKDNNKTTYKLSADSAIRFGNGSTNKLRFETFNGNIYIKKQS